MRTTLFLQKVLKASWIPPSGKICKLEKENKTKPTNKQKKATGAAGSDGKVPLGPELRLTLLGLHHPHGLHQGESLAFRLNTVPPPLGKDLP